MKSYVITILALLATLTGACGSRQSERQVSEDELFLPNSDLSKALLQLQSSENVESCDRGLRKFQRELVAALVNKKEQLARVSVPSDPLYETIPFGNSYLRSLNPVATARKGWQKETNGWGEIYSKYRQIKNGPVDIEWLRILFQVRSILMEDQQRILGNKNSQLGRADHSRVEGILEKVNNCIQDSDCYMPPLARPDLSFVMKNTYYGAFYRKIQTASDDEPRIWMEVFRKRLIDDLSFHYRFTKNKTVRVTLNSEGKRILTVPVDGSVFDDEQRRIVSESVEGIWKNNRAEVKLWWTNASKVPGLFRFFFENIPGNRAYVNLWKHEIHIFPLTFTQAIAHEMGHVLGIKDHYYTTWDPVKCHYETQYTDEDIMSLTGAPITEGDWKTILDAYN